MKRAVRRIFHKISLLNRSVVTSSVTWLVRNYCVTFNFLSKGQLFLCLTCILTAGQKFKFGGVKCKHVLSLPPVSVGQPPVPFSSLTDAHVSVIVVVFVSTVGAQQTASAFRL